MSHDSSDVTHTRDPANLRPGSDPAGPQDGASFCLGGHLAPAAAARRCPICGARTIAVCPGCREPIFGLAGVFGALHGVEPPGHTWLKPPQYCHCCGRPFPWTERVMSAVRMAIRDLTALDRAEREQLRRSIEHIVHPTAQTRLAVVRINAALSRLGTETAVSLRGLFISIASDEAKAMLTGKVSG